VDTRGLSPGIVIPPAQAPKMASPCDHELRNSGSTPSSEHACCDRSSRHTYRPRRSNSARPSTPSTVPSATTSRARASEPPLETCHNVKRFGAQGDLGAVTALRTDAVEDSSIETPDGVP
jgi:hypothetical protein